MVGLTLGTGVGAGIIIDGKLYNGVNTGAGEIGSLPYLDADYEFYCSSRFFSELHGETGATFAKLALAGDQQAQAVWQEFGQHIGNLLKAILFTYAPEAIIIGGGIANAFALYETAMRQQLGTFPYPENVAATRIEPSTLPNAAMLGAAALITEK
jgi:glucokinase